MLALVAAAQVVPSEAAAGSGASARRRRRRCVPGGGRTVRYGAGGGSVNKLTVERQHTERDRRKCMYRLGRQRCCWLEWCCVCTLRRGTGRLERLRVYRQWRIIGRPRRLRICRRRCKRQWCWWQRVCECWRGRIIGRRPECERWCWCCRWRRHREHCWWQRWQQRCWWLCGDEQRCWCWCWWRRLCMGRLC